MKSEIVAVDVILHLGNAAPEDAIQRSFLFYSATYLDKNDPSLSFKIKYNGIHDENIYRLTFVGASTDVKPIAEGVHRFMESFLEEFYDESLEEDWLCELGCEELPTIVAYDVECARAYCDDEVDVDVY